MIIKQIKSVLYIKHLAPCLPYNKLYSLFFLFFNLLFTNTNKHVSLMYEYHDNAALS